MKTKWYLANLIMYPIIRERESLKLLNEKNLFYWDNLVLVKASSTEIAYKKAHKFGKESEDTYTNSEGNYVEWKFAGLRELVEVYNSLDDGNELAYSDNQVSGFIEIHNIIPSKNELGVFMLKDNPEKIPDRKEICNYYLSYPQKAKEEFASEEQNISKGRNNQKGAFFYVSKALRKDTKNVRRILGDINKNL